MRLRIKIQIVALLFISMLALFACSKDENDEPTKPPQPEPKDEKNMLSEKARVITQDKAKTAQVVFNEATQKLTVKNSSELSKPIKQGDIIVSGENGGYLRKVIAITKNGNEVIASTEQATLEEAFKNLDLTLNVPIEPKSTKAQEQGLYEAVYYDAEVVPGKPMAFTVQPNILTKGGNSRLMERKFKIALDKDSLIYAKGKIKIAPTLKGNIKIEKLKLKKLNLGFEIEENISLEYYAGKKFSTNKIIKDKKLAHWAYKDIIVVVGGVPIAIRPVLDFYVGFEASSEAKVNMKAEQKYSYTTGYLYENNKWDRYHNEKKSASLKPPTIEGKAKAKAYIKPVLALEFYRIVAPNIEVETGIEAKIKAAASPINGFSWDWSIGAYLEANMGVAVKVLGKSITNAKFADPILELNFPIASAKDYKGNRAPETPTLTSPKNDTTTEKQTVSFTWQCKDYNKDALIYTLFYTTEKNGAIYSNWKKKENISATTYQLDNLGYGTYYWKVLAKESKTKDKLQAESPVYSFTISKANNAPTKPELTKPANNKTVEAKKILLEWKASSDADNDKISYTIFMSEANSEKLAVVQTNYEGTSYEINSLKAGTYKWQIVATDGKANTKSKIYTFKVEQTPNLAVDKKELIIEAGQIAEVNITAGSGKYTIASSDVKKATATVGNEKITIKALAKGVVKITVTDAKTKQTQQIKVTVTAKEEQSYIEFTTNKAVGETIELTLNADEKDKKNIWIDLNNNGVKDTGEKVTSFGLGIGDKISYTLGSQIVRVYGRVTHFVTYHKWDKQQKKHIGQSITKLDVSHNLSLEKLYCPANELTDIDISKNTNLLELYCWSNKLSNLDVSKNIKLVMLHCTSNQLKTLDVSNNTQLVKLICANNQLRSLDVDNNTKLDWLHCTRNQLTTLDVSNNVELTELICSENSISKLDVRNNTKLIYLHFYYTNISSINLNAALDLRELLCNNTPLRSLDISKNNRIGEKFYVLDVTNTPNLSCIKVNSEQLANIPNNWKKDTAASYNTNCDGGAVALPTITNTKVSNVEATNATFSADLESTGNTEVTEYGFCYSKNNTVPTLDDTKVTMGATSNPKSFTKEVEDLQEETTYYMRAFATNSKGTAYSSKVVKFTTEEATDVVMNGLLAYYTFDQENADDYLGNEDYNGVLQGQGAAPLFTTDTPSSEGKAVKFERKKFYFLPKCPDKTTEAVTYSAWIKMPEVIPYGYGNSSIYGTANYSTYNTIQYRRLSVLDKKVYWSGGGSSYFKIDISGLLIDNKWHHLVITTTNSVDYKLYIDGRFYKDNYSLKITAEQTKHALIGYGFKGTIDNLRIYNRALTKAEIKKIYKAKQ